MKKVLFLFLLLAGMTNVYGQKFAVKSNLLYDATATINLGVEMGLSKKWTLDLSGNYNGWKFGDDMRWKHWMVQPEARYWLRSLTAIFSECMPIMPIIMSAGSNS